MDLFSHSGDKIDMQGNHNRVWNKKHKQEETYRSFI